MTYHFLLSGNHVVDSFLDGVIILPTLDLPTEAGALAQ